MAEREVPIVPPRPVFETLPKAVAAAIAHGNTLPDLNVPRWAATYGCSEADVMQAFEEAQWLHTQQPQNSFEEGSDK